MCFMLASISVCLSLILHCNALVRISKRCQFLPILL